MNLARFSWRTLLAYLLATFFLVGSMGNIFVSEGIAADYTRWGYPTWFHYVTGFLELAAAVLLWVAAWRFWGALLGAAVMLAAAATVMLHGEYVHAIAPLVVVAILTILMKGTERERPFIE